MMEGISRLDLPARKFFIIDLQSATRLHSVDSSFGDIKSWKCEATRDTSFSIVWLQGNVSASIVGVIVVTRMPICYTTLYAHVLVKMGLNACKIMFKFIIM